MPMKLKGKFSSGIEGALASKWNHDFNWQQLSEMILCIILLMFLKFIWVTFNESILKQLNIYFIHFYCYFALNQNMVVQ